MGAWKKRHLTFPNKKAFFSHKKIAIEVERVTLLVSQSCLLHNPKLEEGTNDLILRGSPHGVNVSFFKKSFGHLQLRLWDFEIRRIDHLS